MRKIKSKRSLQRRLLQLMLLVAGAVLSFVVIAVLYLYLSLPNVAPLKTQNPAMTALIQYRLKQAQKDHQALRIKQQWVSFGEIPKRLKDAVRITEDAAFYQHEGIDFIELKAAVKTNWEKGEYVRGASTITQQLAKNLFLSPRKSIFRKFREYFIAKQLEAHLSKDRIFHLYLNVIEFGPGIFGVEAASRHYFHKSVSDLSLEEIIRLTAVIPKPLKEKPTGDSPWLKWKTQWILDGLKRYNYINQDEYQAVAAKLQ
jgi:monofunctional biosynthetic peptidoglycan transglycosylase